MSIFKKLFRKNKVNQQLKFYQFPVVEIQRETDKAVTLSFEKPEEGFDFIPGQYLTLKLKIDGNEVRRAYSLCSLPTDNQLKVTVKETPDGYFSKYINQQLTVGDVVDVFPPQGNFHYKADETQSNTIVAFAGGSGITPIYSIINSILQNEPNSNIILIYGNRMQSEIIFKDALQALTSQYKDRFQLIHVLSDEEQSSFTNYYGLIDKEKISLFAQNLLDISTIDGYYLCGPGEMITTITNSLIDLGVSSSNIHTELFSAPLTIEEQNEPDTKPKDELVIGANLKLTYGNETKELPYENKKDSVLDVALNNGLKVPFSCLNGVCSTCSAKLESGSVKMDQNFALEPEDIADGYILTCQSRPTSTHIEINWDDNKI